MYEGSKKRSGRHPRQALAEVVRLRELRRDDERSLLVHVAPFAVEFHTAEALMESVGILEARLDDPVAAVVDEAPERLAAVGRRGEQNTSGFGRARDRAKPQEAQHDGDYARSAVPHPHGLPPVDVLRQ